MYKQNDYKTYLTLTVVSALILTLLNYHDLGLKLHSYGDSSTLYIFGSAKEILSVKYPWWTLFEFTFRNISLMYFPLIINILNSYLGILLPISMFFLLRELRLNRVSQIGGAILYLGNPIVLHHLGILDWTFFASFPLALLSIIRYNDTGKFRYLLWLLVFLEIPIQIDWVNSGIATLRFLILALGLFVFSTIWIGKKDSFKLAMGIVIFVALFSFVNSYAIYTTMFGFASYSYISTVGSSTVSSFYNFHFSNVIYTYSGQNVIYAFSGLMMYKGSNLFLMGYDSKFLSLSIFWFVIVISSIIFSFVHKSYFSLYFRLASITIILMAIFQLGVYYHYFLFLFAKFPFLFVYENPSFIDRPQAFLEVILIAAFLNHLIIHITSDKTLHRQNKFSLISVLRKNKLAKKVVAALLILFIIIVPSIPVYNYAIASDVAPANSAFYVPSFYNEIGTFFSGNLGQSRVLILPLNFTTYSHSFSVIPSNHLLYVAAGSVNNNGQGPANASILQDVFHSILNRNQSEISKVLSMSNVKYILVTNSSDCNPISVSGNYIDGSYLDFNSLFNNPKYFTKVDSNSDFSVYLNKGYVGPVLTTVPNILSTFPIKSPPFSGIFGILNDSNFSGSNNQSNSLWHPWSDEPKRDNIVFGRSNVTLNVSDINSTIGGLPPVSQIYQGAPVFPGESLSFQITFKNISQCTPLAFLTFDNKSSIGDLYPMHNQFYYLFNLSNRTSYVHGGSFILNTTAPPDAYYVNAGILVHNANRGNGTMVISKVQLYNTFTGSYYGFPSYPDISTMYLPRGFGLSSYLPIDYFVPLRSVIDNASMHNISFAPAYGLYISNHSTHFSIPESSLKLTGFGVNLNSHLPISGNVTLQIGNFTSKIQGTGVKLIDSYLTSNDILSISVNISVNGTAILGSLYFFDYQNGLVNVSIKKVNTDYSVKSDASGKFLVESVELPKVIRGNNITIEKYDGIYFIYGNITPHSSVIIAFPFLSDVKDSTVLYNIFSAASIVLIAVVAYWDGKRYKKNIENVI